MAKIAPSILSADVDMDPVSLVLLQIVDGGLQVREVSGQDGRCDLCHK